MFDVNNKSAVERLAAVVVMLESREAEAREAYEASRDRLVANDRGTTPMSMEDHEAEQIELYETSARHDEAQSALAAARELAPRDL